MDLLVIVTWKVEYLHARLKPPSLTGAFRFHLREQGVDILSLSTVERSCWYSEFRLSQSNIEGVACRLVGIAWSATVCLTRCAQGVRWLKNHEAS